MDLKIINPLEFEGWDDLIAGHPDATIFHTASWARVLSDSYGYRPLYFTKIESGELKALVPMMEVKSFITGKRGVSLPFTDYCPPLLTNGRQIEELLEPVFHYAEMARWKTIELRDTNISTEAGMPSATYLTHQLKLELDGVKCKQDLRHSTARNIRKALRHGIEVSADSSLNGMYEFCRLNTLTRKRHGLPPQPSFFFSNVFKHIISPGHGTLFLASGNGKIVSANIFFHFQDKAIYKYGAMDNRFSWSNATSLLMAECIDHYTQRGYRTLDFGRTSPDNHGLRQFKNAWRPAEHEIHYYTYNVPSRSLTERSPLMTLQAKKLFKKMPLPLLKKLGSLLYRHTG